MTKSEGKRGFSVVATRKKKQTSTHLNFAVQCLFSPRTLFYLGESRVRVHADPSADPSLRCRTYID